MVADDNAQDAGVQSLVARAKGGDSEAFGRLYDRFAGGVYRYAIIRLREPADAQDLVQRVFLRVIEALPTFEQRGAPFGAWLFRIARNAVIDIERGRRPMAPIDALAEHWDTRPGPAQLMDLEADRAAIRAALDTLTAEQREVVVLRFFAGLTPGEVASVMGKREGSVRALQFRALAALRRQLETRSAFRGEPDRAPA